VQTPQQAPRSKRHTSRDNPWPYPDVPAIEKLGFALFWLHQYFRDQAQRHELKKVSDRSWRNGKYALQIAFLHADDAMRYEIKDSLTMLVYNGGLLMAFPETTALSPGGAA